MWQHGAATNEKGFPIGHGREALNINPSKRKVNSHAKYYHNDTDAGTEA